MANIWPVQMPSAPQDFLYLYLLLSLFIRNLLHLQVPSSPWSWPDVPTPGWFLMTRIPLVFLFFFFGILYVKWNSVIKSLRRNHLTETSKLTREFLYLYRFTDEEIKALEKSSHSLQVTQLKKNTCLSPKPILLMLNIVFLPIIWNCNNVAAMRN